MLEKYKKQILDIVFKQVDPDDCVIFVFGSYAADEPVGSSDIDVGILCRNKLPAGIFVDLQEKLNEEVATLREVDFVDFSAVSDKVRKEALKEVCVWHTGINCQGLLKNLIRR